MQQFLVIQLARFGDLVQTKRLIKSLELRGQVHLCIDESLASLANILYPTATVHTLPVHNSPSEAAFKRVQLTLKDLSLQKFDCVYNLNYASFNRVLARFFEPEQVCGYVMHGNQAVHSSWIRKAFIWTQNRVISPLNLVDFWAFFDDIPIAPQRVNPKAKAGGKGIGVVLAGRESRRSLPPPVLAQVLRNYFEVMDGPTVYLLGSAAEVILARQLKRKLPPNMLDKVVDLSGKTSWKGLVEAIQGLDVVISPDTGSMHFAAHLGVPVQAFFLSSAWCHETGPYGEGHGVWQITHDCAPCLESAPCPINTKCLDVFKHKDFLHALTKIIQKSNDKSITLPADLVYYNTFLDKLGSAWQVTMGEDRYLKRRQNLRAVLAEQCGYALDNVPIKAEMVEILYDEADWMLS